MIQSMEQLLLARDGGAVARFHTTRVRPQSVAEHCCGVAQILLYLHRGEWVPPALMDAAINHDVYEAITGDMPATTKWDYPDLDTALDKVEEELNVKWGMVPVLTAREQSLLKWADMADLTMYALEQLRSGNTYAEAVFTNGVHALRERYDNLMGPDQARATGLLMYLEQEGDKWM
jgi:5'-deoxynucleotidase YfbR-like HD superfamily hydrolase